MNNEDKIVKLKLDVIFKRVFGDENNTDIIAAFVAALLDIPQESIKNIYIKNSELSPDYFELKFGRFDLKLDVDGRTVNIEMQVNFEPDFKDRTLFYWAKMFGGELKSGDMYNNLKKTICINIINFNLFNDREDYHSCYVPMEVKYHDVLSDKAEIHFFELRKVDKARKHEPVEDWLDLINAETVGDLMAIQEETKIPEVKKTIVKLITLSGDEKVREEAYYREKQLHDEASALGAAEARGEARGEAKKLAEIISIMRENGFTEEQIMLATTRKASAN